MANIFWDKIDASLKYCKHKMIWHAYGFPKIGDLEHTCFHDAPISDPWDVDQKMAVSVAITGSFFRHEENPNQPVTDNTIRESAREVLAAGASTVHIHVRDHHQHNILSCEQFHNVIAPLKEEFPGLAVDGCLVPGLSRDWDEMKKTIDTKILDAAPVNSTAVFIGDSVLAKPPAILIEKTRMIQEAGGVPEIAVYNDADISNADRYLLRSGLMGPGAMWLILPALPGCSPMENPKQMVEGVTRMVNTIRDVDPQAFIMVCAAGRASMHLATLAASLGLHIRIGMEDTYYMWPHRDDRINSNLQCFELAMQLSEVVGRPIMTRQEYRDRLLATAAAPKAA
ncbi:MAG: 3-keto-5-aminohexanoate cleavage protein [Pseudomonadota bacterium]